MADFGIVTIPTHYTIQPVEFARWAEENGFESLFFGEHSHIPASRKTPFPLAANCPDIIASSMILLWDLPQRRR